MSNEYGNDYKTRYDERFFGEPGDPKAWTVETLSANGRTHAEMEELANSLRKQVPDGYEGDVSIKRGSDGKEYIAFRTKAPDEEKTRGGMHQR